MIGFSIHKRFTFHLALSCRKKMSLEKIAVISISKIFMDQGFLNFTLWIQGLLKISEIDTFGDGTNLLNR